MAPTAGKFPNNKGCDKPRWHMEHRKSAQWTISMASGEFRVRWKKTQNPNHKMPVQPLLDCHRNHHPSNGWGIAIFWTASNATAAATDIANATQPMEEASATATATNPMEEPLHKMKIMRLRINESIWFEFLSRKRLWFEFSLRKRLSGKQNFPAKKTERGTKNGGRQREKNGSRSKNGGWWPGMHWQILKTGWRNFFFSCAVSCVSFWFWREIGFGFTYLCT